MIVVLVLFFLVCVLPAALAMLGRMADVRKGRRASGEL